MSFAHLIESLVGISYFLFRNARLLDEDDDKLQNFAMIEQVVQTNLTGLIHVTRKAFHLMKKSNDYGLIINIGSITGHIVPNIDLNFGVYPATKHAVTNQRFSRFS